MNKERAEEPYLQVLAMVVRVVMEKAARKVRAVTVAVAAMEKKVRD